MARTLLALPGGKGARVPAPTTADHHPSPCPTSSNLACLMRSANSCRLRASTLESISSMLRPLEGQGGVGGGDGYDHSPGSPARLSLAITKKHACYHLNSDALLRFAGQDALIFAGAGTLVGTEQNGRCAGTGASSLCVMEDCMLGHLHAFQKQPFSACHASLMCHSTRSCGWGRGPQGCQAGCTGPSTGHRASQNAPAKPSDRKLCNVRLVCHHLGMHFTPNCPTPAFGLTGAMLALE